MSHSLGTILRFSTNVFLVKTNNRNPLILTHVKGGGSYCKTQERQETRHIWGLVSNTLSLSLPLLLSFSTFL